MGKISRGDIGDDAVLKAHAKARRAFESKELTWREKYDFLFSDDVQMLVEVGWSPVADETTHEEDARAFMSAFDEHVTKYKNTKGLK